ncbi:class I SAM-dependent methyltransferase [Rhizobium sp. IMFF44]|uniref:class I SAM-dependent methyltransferase n=1 Tax=Rhizobium sp. IMFF44 TaxID=3342350 RepID=UPI0035BAA59E
MHTLLAFEGFAETVLEPACGRGAISRMLESAGYSVLLADLIDYETADQHGELQAVQDFLTSKPPESGSFDIVTNPPYGDVLNAFVAHALRAFRPRKMALLLNLNFLCGFDDEDRNFVMDDCPPARVYVFKRRLPMMHRDGWDGEKASSRMNTAWFVWEMQEDGSYGDSTLIRRVDWKNFLPEGADVAEAESEAV